MGSSTKRCLICRHPAAEGLVQRQQTEKGASLRSCALSLCSIFGIPTDHPFRVIYEKAQYCVQCLKELQKAAEMWNTLEEVKQALLRFQMGVYSKLGDNYWQIENRDELMVSPTQFEMGQKAIQGQRYSYNEIVKVIYEKLETDCLKWERFSNERNDKDNKVSRGTSKVHCGTQTDFSPLDVTIDSNVTHDDYWNDDCNFDEMEDQMEVETVSKVEAKESTSSTTTASLEESAGTSTPSKPRKSTYLLFNQTPVNFDEKIFCSVDPENCKRFFFDDYNLQVHIRSFHEGNPLPYQCTECEKEFVDESRLRGHFKSQHLRASKMGAADVPVICEHCGKSCPNASALKKHIHSQHIAKKMHHKCNLCGAPFEDLTDLKTHEDLHRSKEEELQTPFICVVPDCMAILANTLELKRHFLQNHTENPFTCEICGKVLANAPTLKRHLVIHRGDFMCDQCTFSGSCMNSLRRHQAEKHTTEKPFTCDYCGMSFKTSKNLRGHVWKHTGEKPYKCPVCGEAFREWSKMRRHEDNHNPVANYQCSECGKMYKVREDWVKHLRTHRPGYVAPIKNRKKRKPRTEAEKEARKLKDAEKRAKLGRESSSPRTKTTKKSKQENLTKRRRQKKKDYSSTSEDDDIGVDELKNAVENLQNYYG